MEKQVNGILILKAINEFVECLSDVFSQKRSTPFGRYKRLIKHIKSTDQAFERFAKGFLTFFQTNKKLNSVARNTAISYSNSIYIPIGFFLSTPEKDVVLRHLFVIRELFGITSEPCEGEATTNGDSSKEKAFVQKIIDQIENSMGEFEASTPTEALQKLASSSLLQSLTSQLEEGVKSGEYDGLKLVAEMQKIVPALISRYVSQGGDMSQINKILPVLTSMTGGGGGDITKLLSLKKD
jgi:hypothetical protein